jgi:hypothetical protein
LASFVVGALAICVASRLVVASAGFEQHPGHLSYAVFADLVVTMPLLYYLAVVRGRAAPAVTVLPVLLVGLLLSRWLLPEQPLHQLPVVLAAAAETVVLVWAGAHAIRLRKRYRRAGLHEATFIGAFGRAVRDVFGTSFLTGFVIAEVSTWYYALFRWRTKPEVEEGTTAFTSHRRVGWGAVLLALSMAVLVESFATHVLVARLSTRVAWVLTALSAYGLLWLLGDYRALVLRPTLLGPTALRLRIGTRWQLDVPLRDISAVRPYVPEGARSEGFRRATVLGPPTHTLLLRRPLSLEGPFGIRRMASSLGVAMDQADFIEVLRARLPKAGIAS